MTLLPQFTISDGKRTEKAGSNKYWVNFGKYVETSPDNYQYVISETHNLPYYKGADIEILFASWYLPAINDKDSWINSNNDDGEHKNRLIICTKN